MANVDKAKLQEAFTVFDADKSGKIDAKELKAVIKVFLEQEKKPTDDKSLDDYVACCLSAVDTSGDGKISFEEFYAAFKM